jgi:hypothetical protein
MSSAGHGSVAAGLEKPVTTVQIMIRSRLIGPCRLLPCRRSRVRAPSAASQNRFITGQSTGSTGRNPGNRASDVPVSAAEVRIFSQVEPVASGHIYCHEGARRPVWRAKIRLPDGRSLHRTIGPAWTERGRPPAGHYTRRLAERWLRVPLHQADKGTFARQPAAPGVTVGQFAEQHFAHLIRDRAIKPTTRRDVRSMLDRHVVPRWRDVPVETVTREEVERWQLGLQLG